MAITTFARIQHRRGIKTDLPPALHEGELGWCVDTRELFIGNGEPFGGNTQILTAYSPNNDLITNFWRTKDIPVVASVARPLGAKLNDMASVKDFGATGDGVSDDSVSINTAIAELFTSLGAVAVIDQAKQVTIHLPAGTYAIEAPLLLYPNLNLVGDGIGNTVILITNMSMLYAMETADSQGNTGANIGSGGATLPQNISVRDLTINTNGLKIDAAQLNRYSGVRFENVEFVGGYVVGDGGFYTGAGVRLQTLAAGVDILDASFVNCRFTGFTYGLYADEDIRFTSVVNCTFSNSWRGVNFGQVPVNGGPAHTTVTASSFTNIDNYAVYYAGTNYGLSSVGNRFRNAGVTDGVRAVVFGNPSIYCSSIGDVFDTLQGVSDYGVSNLVHNGGQTNVGVAASRSISFTKIFAPTAGQSLYMETMRVPVEFPVDLADSSVTCATPPTNPYTITLNINGVPFATADFAALSTVATFTAAAPTSFVPGDVLEIVAPNPDDPAITSITFDLTAYTS